MHGPYLITWPLAYLESWPQFRVQCYAFYKFSILMLPNVRTVQFCITLYLDQNSHSLSELPVAHLTPSFSPYVLTTELNFLVENDPLQYCNPLLIHGVMYPLSNLTTCLYTVQFTLCKVFSISRPLVQAERLYMAPDLANIDRFHCIISKLIKSYAV